MQQPSRQHVTYKPATVLLSNDDGTFKVLPDSGRGGSRPIDGVRPIVEAELVVGDRVVLVYQRSGDHPQILTVGGGGCGGEGLTPMGVWVD